MEVLVGDVLRVLSGPVRNKMSLFAEVFAIKLSKHTLFYFLQLSSRKSTLSTKFGFQSIF